jgi:periplasmic protein TonB
MNRLQKKCLIAVAGTHLLALVALLCSGFFIPSPKPDNSQVLNMIPAKLIDQAFSSGVRVAQPPPPVPTVQPQQQPQPQPELPKPVEPVKQPVNTQPDVVKPVDNTEPKPTKPQDIKVSLVPVVRKNSTEPDKSEAAAKAAAKEAKRLRDERAKAIAAAANAIKEHTSSATTIDMPGDSSTAYADYASVVKTRYTDAWMLPEDAASDDANVKVSVTIANDGRVTDAHVVEKSGDASVDNSVQRTLDRVTKLEPFPDGSTDKERTYIINFNLKAKRLQLG